MKIEGYDDLRTIGRGGFGVVYRGRDRRFARDVAVKVLTGVLDETMAARFERECHAVGALSGHPHIVVVHDSGTSEDGLAYLVMELLSGGSLAERLAVTGPQSWPAAAELGVQLGGALETAHRGGVLHRDVKPENVLLSSYRQPKLVDFGIATVRGGFETKSASVSASLAHAAPEILAGKRSSTASDVYALGSTLFQVLTGRPAFINPDDETLFPLLARIGSDPVPDLREHGVPGEVAAVIERSMAKAPEDRYESALAFALDLQQAAVANGQVVSSPIVVGDDGPVAAPPAPLSTTTQQALVTPVLAAQVPVQPTPDQPVRRPRRRLVALSAGAAVLVAGGAFVALHDGSTPAKAATYSFTAVGDATASLKRTWSLSKDGAVLSNDTALSNPGTTTVTRTAVEVIPKSVAGDVQQVTFTPADVTVVQADPVVRWKATLAPGAVAHLRWTVRLAHHASNGRLTEMALDQLAAEKAMSPQLPAIAKAAGVRLTDLVPLAGGSAPVPGTTRTPAAGRTTPPVVVPGTTPPVVPGSTTGGTTGGVQPHPGTTTPAPVTTTPATQPPLKAPGVPRSVRSGSVTIVAHKFDDPNAEPTSTSVLVSWAAPSTGGAVASYCVAWTTMSGGSPYSGASRTITCGINGTSKRITVPHVNPANSWLRWEVRAVNKTGAGAWTTGLAVVPDLVGDRETNGVDRLRAAGIQFGFDERSTSDSSQYCKIFDQAKRSGTVTGGTNVFVTYYVCN